MSISPCHISRFSTEFQLACACCRVALTTGDRAEIKRLLALVDVPAFVDLVVSRHRIGSIVHAVLGQLPASDLPPGLMELLSASARHNAVKALQAQRTHIMLARWFAQAGIDWLPFKGLTVAQRYYGDFALRQVNDLDVLVSKSKLMQARALLEARGFRLDAAAQHWDLAERGPRHRDYLMRYFHDATYCSREFGIIELHWKMTDNAGQFNVAPERLLHQADLIEMGGVSMRVMNDVDLLLYLCEHGGRHGWYRLKWLADLPRVLASRQWNWQWVFECARSAGSVQTLLLGLALCRDLFAWAPPVPVDKELRSMRLLPLMSRLVRYKLLAAADRFDHSVHLPLKWRLLDSLRAFPLSASWRTVAQHLWRRSLSPNDLRVLHLPDRWFGLYYLLRPILFTLRQWRAPPRNG